MTGRLVAAAALSALLLAGCAETRAPLSPAAPAAAAPADWSEARRVDVILDNFEFSPSRLVFERGRRYRLHLENRAGGGHDFDAPAFFRAAALRPDATTARINKAGGVFEVSAGQAADIYLVPSRAGTYPLECSHFLHASFGMTGEIVVK